MLQPSRQKAQIGKGEILPTVRNNAVGQGRIENRDNLIVALAGLRHRDVQTTELLRHTYRGTDFQSTTGQVVQHADFLHHPRWMIVGQHDTHDAAAGATLRYLPQYSPDLNPIEMPFSKFKAYLRKLAQRTIPGIRRGIQSFLSSLKGQECANYLRHAGYASI